MFFNAKSLPLDMQFHLLIKLTMKPQTNFGMNLSLISTFLYFRG